LAPQSIYNAEPDYRQSGRQGLTSGVPGSRNTGAIEVQSDLSSNRTQVLCAVGAPAMNTRFAIENLRCLIRRVGDVLASLNHTQRCHNG
jgi:hypothetical protein